FYSLVGYYADSHMSLGFLYVLLLVFYLFLLFSALFFFNDTSTTEIYTLSLHDALPIFLLVWGEKGELSDALDIHDHFVGVPHLRSEEHTSELQSRENLVCRLLLEKKKNKTYQ